MNKYQFNLVTTIALILFGFGEIVLLYFTPRTETIQLITLYFGLVAAYLVMCSEVRNIRTAAFIGVLTRGIAWLSFPELSDDLYRFLWDGSLILDGVNPYLATPTQMLAENLGQNYEQLYPLLNSPDYYSVYPMVIQIISAFGALAGSDIYLANLIIKLPIFLAEIAIIWMLPRLLIQLRLNPKLSIWYFLNPLVIIETCGNAHFEGLMIFFSVFSIKMMVSKRFRVAGIALALGVATKLIPLILFPFLFKALSAQFRWKFASSFILACVVLFFPFFDPTFLRNFLTSVDLYVQSFEFNASVYYMLRAVGSQFLGYNPIAILGPTLTAFSAFFMIYKWLKLPYLSLTKALKSALMIMSVYYLLATTVHPWYITFVLMLGVLTGRMYPIIWTIVVFLSYTAYYTSDYTEYYWVIALEYAILLIFYLKPQLTKQLLSLARLSNVQ